MSATPSLIVPIAQTILVVNLLPLGCIPAILTLHGGHKAKYDKFGYLSALRELACCHILCDFGTRAGLFKYMNVLDRGNCKHWVEAKSHSHVIWRSCRVGI
jgi:hypothetical protein